MADTTWTIQAREFIHCNCDYGCPCQFNGRPTHGNCCAVLGFEIDHGFHGTTPLDGLRVAAIFAWPGAIHEGNGAVQPIIDRHATPAQRDALLRIISGLDTEPGATVFQVFSATFDTVHEPIDAEIEFEVDIDARTARLVVDGLIDSRGEPIRNPVTGAAHRALIELPNGFEFIRAETGRGWTNTEGHIKLTIADSHSHFAHLNLTQSGVIH
jgi:hypothetical protein